MRMSFKFKIIDTTEIDTIIPLIQKLTDNQYSDILLKERFAEMITQNYECAGIYDNHSLIGITGLWFCTRHYSGKSVELDHVYIDEAYRGKGLGKQFLAWIYYYLDIKGCKTVELNTYVQKLPISQILL